MANLLERNDRDRRTPNRGRTGLRLELTTSMAGDGIDPDILRFEQALARHLLKDPRFEAFGCFWDGAAMRSLSILWSRGEPRFFIPKSRAPTVSSAASLRGEAAAIARHARSLASRLRERVAQRKAAPASPWPSRGDVMLLCGDLRRRVPVRLIAEARQRAGFGCVVLLRSPWPSEKVDASRASLLHRCIMHDVRHAADLVVFADQPIRDAWHAYWREVGVAEAAPVREGPLLQDLAAGKLDAAALAMADAVSSLAASEAA